ncbi:MAG: hypothetical protein A2234_05325 [Elusimicrobia bacterium RIFOXYA2_FULL_58_8]|nr:MAG: hypothetical protein A2234_05325 [Elusimicrobia bacterium RIFOXYA2_FULL_58_8]
MVPFIAFAGELGCVYESFAVVQVMKAGTAEWQPAKKGLPLAEGDRVSTGEKGWCEILFRDGTFVKLDSGTETVVEELKVSPETRAYTFNLLRGKTLWMAAKLKVAVTSRFSVRTPAAVCAVRGTDFSISVSSAGTAVGLFAGKVDISSLDGKGKELLPGHEACAGAAGIALQQGFSRAMQAEQRRYEKLKSRVEGLRKRLAERDGFIDDYINRQNKKMADFEARRAEKLKKR